MINNKLQNAGRSQRAGVLARKDVVGPDDADRPRQRPQHHPRPHEANGLERRAAAGTSG